MSESRHIFLSYRSTEADFALKLAADLKNAGVNLWMDRLDISPGDDWRKSLEDAVYSAAAVIAVLSPAYVASRYCQRELARADRLNRPIFPILLGSIPESDWPLEIERQQYIDFTRWQTESIYRKQLTTLVEILKDKFTDQISRIPDPETQYLTHLAAEMEMQRGLIEYLEFSTTADKWLSRDFFRPEPRSIKFWSGHTTFALLQYAPVEEHRAYRKHLFKEIEDVLDKYPRIILIGAAGSGKTTTLRRLILDTIYTYQAAASRSHLPLLLDLLAWEDHLSLEEFIRANWPLDTDPLKLLANGSLALYIDGLGERGGTHENKIKALRDWLHSQNGPQRVVITCRSATPDIPFDLGLPIVQIQDMDRTHIEQFATNYLGNELAQIFLSHILPKAAHDEPHKQHLYQLARNPFLLSAMILAHKSSRYGAVPENLGLLMKQLVAEIWEREHDQPGMPKASFEELETALSDLAYAMTDNETGIYVPDSLALESTGSETLLQVAHNVQFIEMRAGNVRFSQQMFQDYFAALGIARRGLAGRLTAPTITSGGQYLPGKWERAIVMLAGMTPNPDETLLEIARHNPFLALECISSGVNASDHIVEPLIGKLIQIANTPESDARVATASILARIDHELALPILIEAMRDASWDVRWAALLALQEIDIPLLTGLVDVLWDLEHEIQNAADTAVRQLGPWALPTLVKLLQSEQWKMRRSAAWALGRTRDKAAIPALVQALYDEESLVSTEAAASLGLVRDAAAVPWLIRNLQHANWRVRKAAAQALGATGRLALDALAEAVRADNEDVRRLAIESLKEIDDPAVADILLAASYDASTEVRGAAVDALRGHENDAIIARLIECLSDQSRTRWNTKRICDIAAGVLSTINTPEVQVALEQWQKDEAQVTPKQQKLTARPPQKSAKDAHSRLKTITRNGTETPSASPVQTPAESPPWQVRRDNLLTFKDNNNDPAVLPRLIRALDDDSPQVRLAAVETLATIEDTIATDALVRALQDDDKRVVETAASRLREAGKKAISVLIPALESQDITIRTRVIELLGQIGDPEAITHLAALLTSTIISPLTGEKIGTAAANALRAIGTPEALAAINALSGENSSPVKPAEQPEPAPAHQPAHREILTELLDALRRADWGEREDSAKALREYAMTLHGTNDPQILQYLIDALRDPDWVVRWASAEALAWIGNKDAVAALTEALNDPYWVVRIAVVRALLEIRDPSAAAKIIPLLADRHSTVREAVAEALGVLGDPVAVPHLTKALSDEETFVRLSATVALGCIDHPSSIKPLLQALNDPDNHIRWAAVTALISRGSEETVPELINHLDDCDGPYWEDRKICDLAADALLRVGTTDAKAAVSAWQQKRIRQN